MWRAFDASAVALRKDLQNVLGLKARQTPAPHWPPRACHRSLVRTSTRTCTCTCTHATRAEALLAARACLNCVSHFPRALLTRCAAAAADVRVAWCAPRAQLVAAEMGAKYIATLPDAGAGQGVFVPGFQSIGEDLLKVTHASSYNWFVVVDDAQRAAFEASAVVAAQREDPSGALAAQVAALGIREAVPKGGANSSGPATAFQRASPAPFYVARWSSVPRDDPGLLAARLQDLYRDPLRKARARARTAPRVNDVRI
jgi:hypothetical protein